MRQLDIIDLGEMVKQARRERGYTQRVLSEITGVSRARVEAFENGRAPEIAFASVLRMMNAVGLGLRPTTYNEGRPTLDDLVTEPEEPSYAPRMG